MNYIVKYSNLITSDRKWLKRHNYPPEVTKVLNYLVKAKDVDDANASKSLSMNLTSYKEAKRLLVYSGLLEVHKINSTTMVLVLGDKEITSYNKQFKTILDTRLYSKSLASLGLEELKEEDEIVIDTSTYTDIKTLTDKLPTPKPVDIKGVL